jgi:hypothetical protein
VAHQHARVAVVELDDVGLVGAGGTREDLDPRPAPRQRAGEVGDVDVHAAGVPLTRLVQR